MIFLLVFATGGCSPSPIVGGGSSATPSFSPSEIGSKEPFATPPLESPTQGSDKTMVPTSPTTNDPILQNLIEVSKEDLGKRLDISTSQIKLFKAEKVTWPDSSLGCPQEGMAYAQVLTAGYLIMLGSGNLQYEYHSSVGADVFYCPNPTAPVPGNPDNN